jgi:hypothetical protein
MDAQDIRNLSEAYMNVYEQETGRGPRVSDTYDMRDAEGGPKGGGTIKGPKRKNVIRKEETDLYDIILSHLIDEGYAETPEAAEVIMVNMSEGWREDIMEKSDDTYLEPNWKKRKKNNEKAIKDMKNDPNHQKYLETVRKKFG